MEQSDKIDELAKALVQVQKEKLFALTTSENPFFKSKYADLSSVWEVAREPLTKNGLAAAQTLDYDADGVPVIVTTLMHSSGQWIRGRLRMKPAKDDPQGVGSAITYARRYSLSAMLGIAQEDDDAESAMKRKGNGDKKPSPPPEPTKQSGNSDGATGKQLDLLYKKGKTENMTKEEVIEICKWYRKGERLTKKEASQLIENFKTAVGNWREEMMTG